MIFTHVKYRIVFIYVIHIFYSLFSSLKWIWLRNGYGSDACSISVWLLVLFYQSYHKWPQRRSSLFSWDASSTKHPTQLVRMFALCECSANFLTIMWNARCVWWPVLFFICMNSSPCQTIVVIGLFVGKFPEHHVNPIHLIRFVLCIKELKSLLRPRLHSFPENSIKHSQRWLHRWVSDRWGFGACNSYFINHISFPAISSTAIHSPRLVYFFQGFPLYVFPIPSDIELPPPHECGVSSKVQYRRHVWCWTTSRMSAIACNLIAHSRQEMVSAKRPTPPRTMMTTTMVTSAGHERKGSTFLLCSSSPRSDCGDSIQLSVEGVIFMIFEILPLARGTCPPSLSVVHPPSVRKWLKEQEKLENEWHTDIETGSSSAIKRNGFTRESVFRWLVGWLDPSGRSRRPSHVTDVEGWSQAGEMFKLWLFNNPQIRFRCRSARGRLRSRVEALGGG